MVDSSDELIQIAEEMGELLERAREIRIRDTLNRLEAAATEVGHSASKSWLGYHANVYYRNFQSPPGHAYFNRRYGLGAWKPYYTDLRTSGDWEEYGRDHVINTIHSRGGNPEMGPVLQYHQNARGTAIRQQNAILSILDIELNEAPSEFLSQMRQEINALSFSTELELLWSWAPEERTTEDIRAVQEGRIEAPPHFSVLARLQAIENTLTGITKLGDFAGQTELHISRRRRRQQRNMGGTRVFIGHGRSPAWRVLKEFLQDRLGLTTEEFNRVSAAGMPTSGRLSDMMDTAGIAFLVMTAEDELVDGTLRARENVVHEAGLFQGRLGFQRAIVLLEEDCQEFSNIIGLGQIRFPIGNIAPAFEEIRKVLDREGFTGQ